MFTWSTPWTWKDSKPLAKHLKVNNRAAMGYDSAVILCTVGDSAQDDTAVHLWMLLCAIHSVCYGLTE